MNLVTLLTRTTAGVVLVTALVTGCGNGDTTTPSGTGPSPRPAGQVAVPVPVAPTPRPCFPSADQADRTFHAKAVPECLRTRQRAAEREYRRLTRTHTFGHQ
jgi:hypothetical protein